MRSSSSSCLALLLVATAHAVDTGSSSADLCVSNNCDAITEVCTFTLKLDPFASQTGHFTFEECGETPHPVIGLKKDVTYVFDQSDATNWYHPLGFAYFPDGAHVGVDELEPTIGSGACVAAESCQAPVYMKNGAILGNYDGTLVPVVGGDDFGLDVYEPEFFYPRGDWAAAGEYSVKLRLTDALDVDLFYFCHIHAGMSGRIKIIENDESLVQLADDPPLPAGYYGAELSDYDLSCGTSGMMGDYEESEGKCSHDTFVCEGEETLERGSFGDCLRTIDCHMDYNMRTELSSDPVVTFIHQMIPHHQNAINMAKMLLKENALNLEPTPGDRRLLQKRRRIDDDGSCPDCAIEEALWAIINTQAHQIITFQDWLAAFNYPDEGRCDLAPSKSSSKSSKSSSGLGTGAAVGVGVAAGVGGLVLIAAAGYYLFFASSSGAITTGTATAVV